MVINKERVKKTFAEYTSHYDIDNPKVALKVAHTYRVADLSETIARSIDLSEEDCNLAWLIGMLHDVGRFEQVKRYNTFSDAESVDHALLGCEILFGTDVEPKDDVIRTYVDDDNEDPVIHMAIMSHSAYRIPEDISEREKTFCNILRDADKIDILRVQVDTPLEDIYNVTTAELKGDIVTEAVMQAFLEGHTVLKSLKKTSVDHIVGHISLVYELVYDKSIEIVKEQGYINTMLDFESDREETADQFLVIKQCMEDYLNNSYNGIRKLPDCVYLTEDSQIKPE